MQEQQVARPTQARSLENSAIRLTGMFRQGDTEKMRGFLRKLTAATVTAADHPSPIVELSSLGGDLHEGLHMGYLFREFNVATVVRSHDSCMSACALAFLGGAAKRGTSDKTECRRLEIGGRLGFHSFWLNPNSAQQPTSSDSTRARSQGFGEALAGATAVIRYAADLGVDARFIASVLAKPPEEFAYINTAEDFLTLSICPVGLSRPSIPPSQQALNICNHSTGWAERAKSSQITFMTPQQAERYMLENVQQNMLLLNVKGALSNQLASYPVMRNERAIDNLYADLQAAGVRLPKIVGPVFEVDGYQTSEGDTQCFVSLSLDDPDRYEVAIRRPKIWAHANWSAPRDCRRLFLYDKSALINPRP